MKRKIKRILRVREGGPQAVENSLIRGLTELNIPFKLNRPLVGPVDVICVLTGGVKALRWAIKQKHAGLAKKILAGPIIVITPNEDNWLVASPEVDAFVVPSQWVKNWWISFEPRLADKIKLWPSGVKDNGVCVKPAGNILIFQKNAPEDLNNFVASELSRRDLPFEIIKYGSFSSAQYLAALSRSRFMVYLSQSESQGIALFEAWMGGLPTLVWNRGFMINSAYRWEDDLISAPFLNKSLGMFFKGKDDFGRRLDDFLGVYKFFTPRRFSLEHFTDVASAARYLEILNSL
jgi:hypothetical protein